MSFTRDSLQGFKTLEGLKGEITVEADTLAAGIYSYTLIVDGAAADVKQMIVTK